MSANARASMDHKQSHTKHIHVQLLRICLHHSPQSHDFCPIRAYHYPVGKATAMDMVDGPATAGFLASPWRATGTSNTATLRSESWGITSSNPKWRISRHRQHCVVPDELCDLDLFHPILLVIRDIDAQISIYFVI